MKAFEPLYRELDEWNFNGDEAMLWWRDDDAVSDTPALQQLLSLSIKFDLPVALAVIPDLLEDSLVRLVKDHELVQVLQHGVRHHNNAPDGEKKQELSRAADLDSLLTDIAQGRERLAEEFEQQFLPIMVPPWNRIDNEVIELLSRLEFLGLSCFTARTQPEAAENIWLVNAHVDIINWKKDKVFIGVADSVNQLVAHLEAKREGLADRAEPTGLMTHHLVHDQESWEYLQQLFAILDEHPAVTWLSAERAFQTKWRF